MIEQIIIAFENQDYITARKLIEELLKTDPNEPFAQLYLAKLYQVNGQLELAETMYRKILRSTTHAKVLSQARQNLQLLINKEKERRRNALEKAISTPEGKAESVLILEPINNDVRATLAPKFAKVMQIDNYSARMILSSKSWRLYRTGKLGEINFYVEELTKVEIPCFALTIDEIKAINVYKVNYFQVFDQQITVVCTDESSQTGILTFDLTEISQRVEGLLPIFEEVVEFDSRRKLQRKTKTLDYAKICDLHLPQRNSILRMCDYLYDFQEGIRLGESNKYSWENTTLTSWQNLMKLFEEKLSNQTVWRDFTNFAELALDSMEMLQHFESHIDLFRKEDTLWDQAFQLYSGLVFLRQ